jgi:protein subunit release factor B
MNLKFGVSEKKEKELLEKMRKLGIKEEDLIEKFVLSSGKGGQKRNKTSTCVYLKHIPTGIEVKCEKTRSQSLNRFFARRILVEKIEENLLGKESSSYRKILKKIKQKKKREKRAREKYHEEVIPHG